MLFGVIHAVPGGPEAALLETGGGRRPQGIVERRRYRIGQGAAHGDDGSPKPSVGSQNAVVSVSVDAAWWNEGTARSVVGETLEELEAGAVLL